MVRRPPRSTRTDTLCPYTTLFRSFRPGKDAVLVSDFEFPTSAQIWHAQAPAGARIVHVPEDGEGRIRSEEHTSELQSLMRSSYAVCCLIKKTLRKSRLCYRIRTIH